MAYFDDYREYDKQRWARGRARYVVRKLREAGYYTEKFTDALKGADDLLSEVILMNIFLGRIPESHGTTALKAVDIVEEAQRMLEKL